MKSVNALLILLFTGCAVFAQSLQKLRRADSFWGLHFDRHSVLTDTHLGKTLTDGMVDTLLKKARAGFYSG